GCPSSGQPTVSLTLEEVSSTRMRAEYLFGPGTILVEAPARLVPDEELFPEEAAFVAGATESRRAELGTARVCARAALGGIGIARSVIVPREGQGPVWPRGAAGSISHTHGHCAVVVGASPPLRSIGLDVEVVRPLEPGVARMILTDRERAWLDAQPPESRETLLVTVFCAKEAFYKCQHPVTAAFLEFDDVEVELRIPEGSFEARVTAARPSARVRQAAGRLAYEAGRVYCGVELRG
ncbi:MAG: 4'-phosphopantetheinyl transferase family protein, partial [Polyangiaceae bacterium]